MLPSQSLKRLLVILDNLLLTQAGVSAQAGEDAGQKGSPTTFFPAPLSAEFLIYIYEMEMVEESSSGW